MSQDSQSAAQQPSSYADDSHDISLIDDLAPACAADACFMNTEKPADLTFAAGLWWEADCVVIPNSADTKRLILQTFHGWSAWCHQDSEGNPKLLLLAKC